MGIKEELATGRRILRTPRVLFVFVLFWVVLGWGLYDTEIYPKEAVAYAAIWVALAASFHIFPKALIANMVGMVILDIILILRVYGQDIGIR